MKQHGNLHAVSNDLECSRVGDARITTASHLGEVWPGVVAMLRRVLRHKGVSHHDIDDLTQETAARAVSKGLPFEDEDHLARWSVVTAKNLMIAAHRDSAHLAPADLPDPVSADDVERTVIARETLEAVATAWSGLSLPDRNALASGIAIVSKEPNRIAVRRHRARQRLHAMITSVWLVVLELMRRATRAIQQPGPTVASVMPATLAVLFVLGGVGSSGPHDTAVKAAAGQALGSNPAATLAGVATGSRFVQSDATIPTRTPSRSGSTSNTKTVLTLPNPDGSGDVPVVQSRPQEPDDKTFCTDWLPSGHTCVDAPARIKFPTL